jgi:two-component system chemotaxis response regulator CheB
MQATSAADSVRRPPPSVAPPAPEGRVVSSRGSRIRVLVVDDSLAVRRILAGALAGDRRFEVVGTVATAAQALEQIEQLAPDVLTLDLDLPGMSGIELLRRLRATTPVPTVVVSALGPKALAESLSAGAAEVVAKPNGGVDAEAVLEEIRTKVALAVATAHSPTVPPAAWPLSLSGVPASARPELIAIGASTGGPKAIHGLLSRMPTDAPPIVVAVHMPAGITRAFADHLRAACRVDVAEAQDGDRLVAGRALVAPGGAQLRVRREGEGLVVAITDGERVAGFAPCVDVLFTSVAESVGRRASAALLTGMGSDGAEGMAQLKGVGARTFAQDAASCVVYGMPRAAVERGVALSVALSDLPARLLFG